MMTLDEKYELLCKVQDLEKEGKFDIAAEVQSQIPISAHIAMGFKEAYGSEYMKSSGINLSEAEEVYGKDWLEK